MNLLVVTVHNDRSEVEVYRLMAQQGHQLHVVAAPTWPDGGVFEGTGVTLSRLAVRSRLDFKAVPALRQTIRDFAPDVIYAPRNKTLSVTLMATGRHRVPVVAYRGTTGHLSRWDPAAWLTYFNPRLRHIICVSEAVRQYLLGKEVLAEKLSTIYKGHRLEWYTQGATEDLQAFGVPPDTFTVGFIGNMRPVKGVDVLLRSLPLIPAELNVHVCLIGEVRDKRVAALCRRPDVAPRVHLAGYQANASRFCGAFDAFVMPSVDREGLPRAVIEAMAKGVPPIVSDAGGMPELVAHGVSGLVVPARDPQALADAIGTLAQSPELRRRYGEQAQRRIATVFNVEETAAKMLALFARLSKANNNDN